MSDVNKLTGAATKQAPVVKKVTSTQPTVTYPRLESFKVVIKPRQATPILPESGTDTNSAETYSNYIGAAFAGISDRRPLGRIIFENDEEEAKMMFPIVGVKPSDRDYQDKLNAYWHSIMVPVDLEGLTLEAGKKWKSAEVWEPINYYDYVLYQYCKKYYRVANKKEDMHKSPKIRFYMWTAKEERDTKKELLKMKDEAIRLRFAISEDLSKVSAILTVANEAVPTNSEDKLIALAELAEKKPKVFLTIGKDTFLMEKYFLEQLVQTGIINRPPNTFIHIYDTVTLGNTLIESVAWLSNPSNLAIRKELEGKLAAKLSGKL